MNKRFFVTSTLLTAAIVATALTVHIERAPAQNLPLDECINVGNGPASRLCLHEFSDHTKCVISVTRGAEAAGITTSALSCKIT